MMFTAIVIPHVLPKADLWLSILVLMVLINSISCYEYFRKRRVVTLGHTRFTSWPA